MPPDTNKGNKRRSEPDLYYQSFRDSNDAIIITDANGIITDMNQAFLNLYGYTRNEVIGRTTRLIKSDSTSREMYEYMWRQITDPQIGFWKGEIINRKKDGAEVPVLLSITPIRKGSRITGYMGIGIDITERKELEEFRELYDTVVRHDLKSPLAGILGYAQLMLDGYPEQPTEKQRKYLNRILRSGRLMLEIIHTSLDMQKIRRGVLHVEMKKQDFMPLLWHAVEELGPTARERNIAMSVRIGRRAASKRDHAVACLDRIQSQRAVDNLVKNAVEAAPLGSVVTLTVRSSDRALTFSVHNGGNPIPPDMQTRMFHPFSTYGKRGGTGLGVYGVKLAVESQGGNVCFRSDEKSGTVFTIYLPKSIKKAAASAKRIKGG